MPGLTALANAVLLNGQRRRITKGPTAQDGREELALTASTSYGRRFRRSRSHHLQRWEGGRSLIPVMEKMSKSEQKRRVKAARKDIAATCRYHAERCPEVKWAIERIGDVREGYEKQARKALLGFIRER
jgi:hypothetical protein